MRNDGKNFFIFVYDVTTMIKLFFHITIATKATKKKLKIYKISSMISICESHSFLSKIQQHHTQKKQHSFNKMDA